MLVSKLVPMSLAVLARRALAEHARRRAVFDLPEHAWYQGDAALDTSAKFHGRTASTPLGPAAGPHSQLAQNIVLSWLAGSRIIELKTVQVKDDLIIPRPCIDAANVGFNVEWSQELEVDQSLVEYTKAWMLLVILGESGVTSKLARCRPHTLFDISLGYDLEGIKSPKVTRFMRGMLDASDVIAELKEGLTGDLARFRNVAFPSRIASSVTLSTVHGCPAHEVAGAAEHLLSALGVHVVIKLSPTLLGYGEVCHILHDRLGFAEIRPVEAELDRDFGWDEALALFRRLREVARPKGLGLGAKLSSALVVENHKRFFAGADRMYMSGQPLYPISMSLALRFREAMGADFPVSFSSGIDQHNFADAVLCGLTPITTCTDLLRPGGYARMSSYLGELEARMQRVQALDLDGYILAGDGAREAGIDDPREASLFNMRRVVARALEDPRYTKAMNASVPRKIGSQLMLFDCISCDYCVPVCPNDANFVYHVRATHGFTEEAYVADDGTVGRRAGPPFSIERAEQIGNYADSCNDCGNCDVFCPEDGGPHVHKPRFFGSRESFERHAKHGGFYVEASVDVVRAWARISGCDYQLQMERASGRSRFSDGQLELLLDGATTLIDAVRPVQGVEPRPGHVLSTAPARSMLAIILGVLDPARVNPVNASLLS